MTTQATVDLSKYVETRFFNERPHIRGRRIPVATIAHSASSQGWTVPELAFEFTLTEAEVLAALLYYAEHTAEIERLEADYQQSLDKLYNEHGSPN